VNRGGDFLDGTGDVTAEPRMEDLLASIRRAIQDDIGDAPIAAPAGDAMRRARLAGRNNRVSDDLSAAAGDIKQLRERLVRPASGPARERAQSVADAIHAAVPRRAWREVEPAASPPRMRSTVASSELASRPAQRVEPSAPREDAGGMLSEQSVLAVQGSFGRLADSNVMRAPDERALETMSREMLRGMLKQWLDDHLPDLVERLVREEIERVARSGR
jgi:cell pole-organizing protein PopZ